MKVTEYGIVSVERWVRWNIFEKFCHNYVVMKDDIHGIMFHAWNDGHAEKKGQKIARAQGKEWDLAIIMPDGW